ncbi:YihY/virulence factor BrkB family protein [Isoalcanivorax beigongshangi]|uniref:YihY/virulence factor BrkB family protein n=1 Tax=Isoalcanivorax beigongshangi TaxID=3238810 RepID=A0ABV4AFU7_9GAMM
MNLQAKSLWRLLRQSVEYWLGRQAAIYAGALAFFTLFSIAPVVILAVQVIGLVLSTDVAMAQILSHLEGAMGAEAAEAVRNAVARTEITHTSLLPTLISLGTMVIGATTVFAQLQRSLNSIWDVTPRPNRNTVLELIRNRFLSLTIVLSIGFVLLVSLLLSVILRAVMAFAADWLPMPDALAVGLETTVSLLVIGLLFATMFKVLPDVKLRWRDVLPGALLTSVLFALGRSLIAVYLSNTATASTYGAAGSLVLLLLWVYYSSLILLFGAAFTRAYTEFRGREVQPVASAVRVERLLVDETQPEQNA